MREPMKMPHTETVIVSFDVPSNRVDEAIKMMTERGFKKTSDSVPWREVLASGDVNIPSVNLTGARHKEGLTQLQLSNKTGIPRRHISEMENGRRSIGKQNAHKLGKVLNIDPRLLLNV